MTGALPGRPNLEGRILVKIYALDSNPRRLSPFTGVSDRTGYFFVPFLPQGVPYVALAIDTITGDTRVSTGIGPATGTSAPMLFDFASPDFIRTPITLGLTISRTVAPGSTPQIFSIASPAGQVIGGSYGWPAGNAASSSLNFQLLYPNGVRGLSFTGISGTNTLPDVILPMSGTYTLLVSDNVTPTGTYTFALSSKPVVNNRLYPTSVITTVAAAPLSCSTAITATTPCPNSPFGVARASDGTLYMSDVEGHRIFRAGADGVLLPFAGTGTCGYSGDGGPALLSQLCRPEGIALAPDGSLYVADWNNNVVRQILPNGTITTAVGNGTRGFSGDGGPAREASLRQSIGLAVAGDGTLYIGEANNHRIRVVSPSGIITTFAGNGTAAFSGDNGPATSAALNTPFHVAIGPDNSVYISDPGNARIRKVSPTGTITTVAGTGQSCTGADSCGDGGPAVNARVPFGAYLAFAPDGALLVVDNSIFRIRRVGADGIIQTIAGAGAPCNGLVCGDGGPASQAQFSSGTGNAMITLDAAGNLYLADPGAKRIRKVSTPGG